MNELVHRCQHSMPFTNPSCYCCHRQDHRCCCSCSSCPISIEEIVTWIIVCSSVFLLYSTLKLYLLIGAILFLIYWMYQRPDIVRWIQRLYQFGVWILKSIQSLLQQTNDKGPVKNNQFDSPAIDPMIETKQRRDLAVNPKVDRPITSSSNLVLDSLDQHENLSSDVSASFSHADEFVEVDTGDDFSIENRSLPMKRQSHSNKNPSTSTAKNLCMETTSLIDREASHPTASTEKTTNAPFLRDTTIPKLDYTNSVSQSGYYGPIHTIFGLPDQSEGDELRKSTSLQWQTRVDASQKGARPLHQLAVNSSDEANLLSHGSVASKITEKLNEPEKPSDEPIVFESVERNREIRQAIARLHTDALRPDASFNRDPANPLAHLSIEDRTVLQLATENLVQAIVSTRVDQNLIGQTPNELGIVDNKHRSHQQDTGTTTSRAKTKLEYCTTSDTDSDTVDHASDTKTKSLSELQPPACLAVQPSLVANSPVPRVPPKATVYAINDDDDEEEEDEEKLSHHDHIQTVRNVLISDDLFENISPRTEQKKLENSLYVKPDTLVFDTEQTDWADYALKREIFSNSLRSDLPVVQSDDQHTSLKQTIFSHFHRRPKLVNNHYPASLHWTSLNATTTLNLIHPCALSTNGYDSISGQQSVTHQFLGHRTPLDYVWCKTFNHPKQGIFRVRKSRILVAFDETQRKPEADGDHQATDSSEEIHRTRSEFVTHPTASSSATALNNNETGAKIANRSIVSLIQSFDSAIRQGELSINNEKQHISVGPNETDTEDPYLTGSDSLYSVASEYIQC